ncbi:MAG: hypothetical protein M3430_03970, partial [Acidobacteriota bacterium]|nr:hypothetical protein [Acidobacteriota bacterium]
SAVTRAMTLREATELDALVYSVYYDTKLAFDYLSKGAKSLKVVRRGTPSPQYLQSLSRKTGGRFYNATNPEVLKQTFAASPKS